MTSDPNITDNTAEASIPADSTLLTIAEAARTVGVSRSTLYRCIRQEKLRTVTLDNGGRRLILAEVLAFYDNSKPKPAAKEADDGEQPQPSADPMRVTELEDALHAERAKVELLQEQLAQSRNEQLQTESESESELAAEPAPREYAFSRRRWKLVRTIGQTFDVFVGGTLIFVVVLALIIALFFSFGGFSDVSTISDF